jgi:hypothetical protein
VASDAKPLSQRISQAPEVHVAVPFAGRGQFVPTDPQFWTEVISTQVVASAAYPVSQRIPQSPEVHVAVPFAGRVQFVPTDPQLSVDSSETHSPLDKGANDVSQTSGTHVWLEAKYPVSHSTAHRPDDPQKYWLSAMVGSFRKPASQ